MLPSDNQHFEAGAIFLATMCIGLDYDALHYARNAQKNERRQTPGCSNWSSPRTRSKTYLRQVDTLNMIITVQSLAQRVTYRELLMRTYYTLTWHRKQLMYNLIKSFTMGETFVSHSCGGVLPIQSTIPCFRIHSQHSKVSKIDTHVTYLMKNDGNVQDFHKDFVSSLN